MKNREDLIKEANDLIELITTYKVLKKEQVFRSIKNKDDNVKMYSDMIIETSSKLNDLKIKSVNRQMLYEIWLLNIREIREKYGYQ